MLVNPEDAVKAGIMFVIKEIELFEGSTVAIGANQLTPFLGVKSGNIDLQKVKLNDKITLIEKQLKKGKQSDETLYEMSIQLRQIKQLINEIEQTTKPTPGPGPGSELSFIDRLSKTEILNQ